MQSRTIKFVDFWPTFDTYDNKFIDALEAKFDIKVLSSNSDETPDILFYSRCESAKHLKYDCLKIYFTGENDFPDFNECDYAISFYPSDCGGRNLRYPLWMLYEIEQALTPPLIDDAQALNRGFCSLVMRNASNCDSRRLEIIDAIEHYKPLAYGGSYRNNVGGCVDDKIEFIGHYKFNLALENSLVEGYVTEKLLEPLAAATVPIYWGDGFAVNDFNPEAFINILDYNSLDSFLSELKRIDNHPSEYLKIIRQPAFKFCVPQDFDSRLSDFLCNIAQNMLPRRTKYGEMCNLHNRNKLAYPLWFSTKGRRALKLLNILGF